MLITTNNLSLEIDEQSGLLSSVICNDVKILNKPSNLFRVSLRTQSGDEEFISSTEMTLCNATDNVLTYKSNAISVTLTFKIKDTVSVRSNIQNNTDSAIEYIELLPILVDYDLPKTNSKILWGFNEGGIIDDYAARQATWPDYNEPKYPGEGTMGIFPAIVETQLMAYLTGESGLYIATHDADNNLKAIDSEPADNSIKLRFRLYTGCNFGVDYTQTFDFVLKSFVGDWHDAADIYRDWFETNKSDEFVKIEDNTDLPEWYGDSPIIVTYPVRGTHDTGDMTPNRLFPYINAIKHIEKLGKETSSRVLVILMHWEGTAPWAPPYVWPPFGGEAELKKFMDALHKDKNVLGLYCSGIGWTIQSNLLDEYNKQTEYDENGLERYMCASPKGKVEISHICTAQRSGYDMCPTQDFTYNVVAAEVQKMVDFGIDYTQVLDQNHGGTSYFCYSREHGHPPVPGKWQVDSMKSLLSKLNKIAGKNKVLLGCESAAAETYLPHLQFSDNRFELNYCAGANPVPLYSYIYHRYLNNFMGNQVCDPVVSDGFDESLIMRMAYSFTAGDMLTINMDQYGNIVLCWGGEPEPVKDRETVTNFVKKANAFRRGYGKKYLHTGKMLKPIAITNLTYRNVKIEGTKDYKAPIVFTSYWQATDNTKGQFIANYNAYPVEISLAAETIYKVDSNGNREKLSNKFTIDKYDIMLIEYK